MSVADHELVRFAERLREAVAAGMPVDAELRAMARATRNRAWRRRIEDAATAVHAGRSLSEAVTAAGFPPRFCDLVALGEGDGGGQLEAVLAALADEARLRWRLRRQMSIATLYPLGMLLLAAAVAAGVCTFFLPAVRPWLVFHDQDGSVVTDLLAMRDTLGPAGLFALAMTGPLLLVALFATERGRRVLSRLPGGRGPARLFAADRLLTALRVATAGAHQPAAAFSAAVGATGLVRDWGRARMDAIAVRLAEGSPVGATLREAGVLPPFVAYVLELAERTTGLPAAIEEARQSARDELEARTGRAAMTAGVALIALAGLFVLAGGLVISVAYGALLGMG